MNNGQTCLTCERPVHFASKVKVWVHTEPLGKLRVSAREHAKVMLANAIFGHGPERIYDAIHQAEPDRSV
jgi:hypothetical protein